MLLGQTGNADVNHMCSRIAQFFDSAYYESKQIQHIVTCQSVCVKVVKLKTCRTSLGFTSNNLKSDR